MITIPFKTLKSVEILSKENYIHKIKYVLESCLYRYGLCILYFVSFMCYHIASIAVYVSHIRAHIRAHIARTLYSPEISFT